MQHLLYLLALNGKLDKTKIGKIMPMIPLTSIHPQLALLACLQIKIPHFHHWQWGSTDVTPSGLLAYNLD